MEGNNKNIRFIDMFGGIGGFRLGIEQTLKNTECVAYYEKDKHAVKSYNNIFNENHNPTNIRNVNETDVPDHELLCAGFPCQSFSIAGERGGFEDTRGTLFFEIARIARQKLPKVLLLENVKGLLSHADGTTFRTVLSTLHELGYRLEWQVLNSKHHGVPQNRERVFIIGHLGDEPGREIFPFTGTAGENSEEDEGERERNVIHPTITEARGRGGSSSEYLNSLKKVSEAERNLTPPGYDTPLSKIPPIKGGGGEKKIIHPQKEGITTKRDGGIDTRNITTAIDSNYNKGLDNHGQRTGIIQKIDMKPVYTPDFTKKGANKKGQIGSKDGLMFTVDATSTHGVTDGRKIRKLTPRECWRLQGFPDKVFESARGGKLKTGYREGNKHDKIIETRMEQDVSDTQLYKQAGNAVTVNVVRDIIKRLAKNYIWKLKHNYSNQDSSK